MLGGGWTGTTPLTTADGGIEEVGDGGFDEVEGKEIERLASMMKVQHMEDV